MLPISREENEHYNTIIYAPNQGCGCAYVFTATLITYNSYIVVSKNREMFQQKAMWKVVLAMLYGAHLYKEDFYIALNNYIVHFTKTECLGGRPPHPSTTNYLK